MPSSIPNLTDIKRQAQRVRDAEVYPSIDLPTELAKLLDMIREAGG